MVLRPFPTKLFAEVSENKSRIYQKTRSRNDPKAPRRPTSCWRHTERNQLETNKKRNKQTKNANDLKQMLLSFSCQWKTESSFLLLLLLLLLPRGRHPKRQAWKARGVLFSLRVSWTTRLPAPLRLSLSLSLREGSLQYARALFSLRYLLFLSLSLSFLFFLFFFLYFSFDLVGEKKREEERSANRNRWSDERRRRIFFREKKKSGSFSS